MKVMALALMLLSLLPGRAVARDFERDLQAALGPYYAALVASSRGNIDQTQRQILLFASKWETVAREAPAQAPAAYRDDRQWRALVDGVADTLHEASDLCRRRDVAGAHARLESIRLALREIDERHNALTVDDHLTDLHDAIQRMIGHVGGLNEIRLKPRDFDDIAEDFQAAEQAWKAVVSSAGPLAGSEPWRAAASRMTQTLSTIDRELQGRRPNSLVPAIEGLRDRYYDLLLAVSKGRG
jgi:hypothetical protein